jgi:phosphoglycolate phosphatase
MKSHYEIIAFDMDGVLVDSKFSIINSLNHVLADLDFTVLDHSRVDLIGLSIAEMLNKATDNAIDQTQMPAAIASYRLQNDILGPMQTLPYPDIPHVLERLAKSYGLIVVTSKLQRSAKQLLKQLNLDQYFLDIFGLEVDGVKESKDVTLIRAQARIDSLMNGSSDFLALVGDKESDIQAAQIYGIHSVGALWGYGAKGELADADFTADQPLKLLQLFDKVV